MSWTPLFLLLFWAGAISAACPGASNSNVEVVFSWTAGTDSAVSYSWPNESFADSFSHLNAVPIGLKVFRDHVYMTVPRWRGDGHPANLVRTARPRRAGCIREPTSPVLEPFPSWNMNKVGDCSALQFVQSFEIDPSTGLMWLPDMGRERGARSAECEPKFVFIDEATGEVERVHVFPPSVVPRSSDFFLNDVVLDLTDANNKFAYVSDSAQAAIVVYDFRRDRSWRAQHRTMRADPIAAGFDFLNPPGRRRIADSAVNGIAFSPGARTVYFSPLTSYSTFAVSSSALREEATAADSVKLGRNIKTLTDGKPSQTDGLTVDGFGALYMTEVTTNTVSRWDPAKEGDFLSTRRTVAQDNSTMVWPDTLSIDDRGYLWATTRGWPIDRSTNAVVRMPVGSRSYLHSG